MVVCFDLYLFYSLFVYNLSFFLFYFCVLSYWYVYDLNCSYIVGFLYSGKKFFKIYGYFFFFVFNLNFLDN